MKTKELINKINKRRTVKAEYRKYYDGSYYDGSFCNINISTKDLNPCNQWFFSFGTDCYSWAGVAKNYDWLTNSVSADDLAYVVAAINEFMDTPIKERFPEKKWLLCLGKNDYGQKIYLTKTNSPLKIETTLNVDCFTEWNDQELQDLVDKFPNLASIIDAMKEPVEEEE